MRIAARVSGAGRPVALVQGLGMAAQSWDAVVDDLVRDHLVITYDRPGMGDASRARPMAVLGLARAMEQLATALDEVGDTRPVVLAGHSLGGFIVEGFARCYPQRVAGVVLIDASIERVPRPMPPWRARIWSGAADVLVRSHGWPRWIGAAALEDIGYYRMAVDLAALRTDRPLPSVPLVVLAAVRTRWAPWDREWLRRQREMLDQLAPQQGDQVDGSWRIACPSSHLVMRSQPRAVADAVRACRRPRGVTA